MSTTPSRPVISFLRSRKVVPAGIIFCCVLYLLCGLALRYGEFISGYHLEYRHFSIFDLLGGLASFASVIVGIFLSIGLVIDTVRKHHPAIYLLLIFLLPLAYFSPEWIPIPSFTDGAVRRLKDSGVSEELVTFAAREIAKTTIPQRDIVLRREYMVSPPFDRLGLKWMPLLSPEGDSLVCLFDRGNWGISISKINGVRPTLPAVSFEQKIVSTEIAVFENQSD